MCRCLSRVTTLSIPAVRLCFQPVLKELHKLILHILRNWKVYPIVPIYPEYGTLRHSQSVLVLCVITTFLFLQFQRTSPKAIPTTSFSEAGTLGVKYPTKKLKMVSTGSSHCNHLSICPFVFPQPRMKSPPVKSPIRTPICPAHCTNSM